MDFTAKNVTKPAPVLPARWRPASEPRPEGVHVVWHHTGPGGGGIGVCSTCSADWEPPETLGWMTYDEWMWLLNSASA